MRISGGQQLKARVNNVSYNEKKSLYHSEQAAIGGHVKARHNLGFEAFMNGKMDTAVKHWIIAAKLGHDDSLQRLKNGFQIGTVSKDVFAAALRAHKAAVDAMKSPQREEAERVWANAEALGIDSPFGYSS
jgi:TPR repeat protein